MHILFLPPCLRGHHGKRGFSLVELAIVLVILGLLVGGILAGQSLIRAAGLRAVATERQHYLTALHSFRDKYFALPGDFDRATEFWGKDAARCNDQPGQTSTPGTCNGVRDNRIHHNSCTTANNESFLVWQHLALAGLIEGQYSGHNAGAGDCYPSTRDTNVPPTKLDGRAGWYIGPGYRGDDRYFSSTQQWLYFLQIGRISNVGYAGSPMLTPGEAWQLDTKMDDGLPGRGFVHSDPHGTTRPDCSTGSDPDSATYRLTEKALRCSLIFALEGRR